MTASVSAEARRTETQATPMGQGRESGRSPAIGLIAVEDCSARRCCSLGRWVP